MFSAISLYLRSSLFLEDFHSLTTHSSASFQHSLARLVFGERAVFYCMCVIPVGAAQGACVRPQDGAHHPPVRGFQNVGAVNLLGRAVIPTEDADLGLLLIPRSRFSHLPLHTEQIKSREAPSDAHLPLRRGGHKPTRALVLVLEGTQDGETLFQVQDGNGGGRRAAARVQLSSALAFTSGRDCARARRGVVQTQGSFQRLRDGVGILRDAVLVLRDQSGQPEIVIPKIKGVVIRVARTQVVVI